MLETTQTGSAGARDDMSADTPTAGARSLIIVRTHKADPASFTAYDLYAEASGLDVTFCVDARGGPVDMLGRNAVAFDRATLARMGLFAHPNSGWQCGDYCYYATRLARPDYDFYWLVEPDVRIHAEDLGAFFAQFADITTDFLAARFGKRTDVWYWTRTVVPLGMPPHGCLFPITRMSGAAVDQAFATRQRLSTDPATASRDMWPNDEAFTASVLVNAGLSCADLNVAGIVCHSQHTLGAGAIVDYETIAAIPPNGLIYHPVRAFLPWLERAETRVAALENHRAGKARRNRLRAEASYLGSVATACLRHPDHADSALVPLMLAHELWRDRLWSSLPDGENVAADRHEEALSAAKLEKRFGPGHGRPWLGEAYTAHRRVSADKMSTVKPDDFDYGAAVPLGRFPAAVALPFAFDMETQDLLFTLHVVPSKLLHAPFLYAAQREMARGAARLPLASLPGIYGEPSAELRPVLIFSLGRTGSTLLERLLGCVTARCISEPDTLTQLANHRQQFAVLAEATRRAMIYYSVAPFLHVAVPGSENMRCVIKLRSQVNGIAGDVADVLPRAKYVFMVRERTAWARSTFRSFRLAPQNVVERLLGGIAAIAALRARGVDLDVVSYEELVGDPVAFVSRIAGADLAKDAALAARLGAVMNTDSQAEHRLARDRTSVPLEGEAAWMAEFERLWAERRPSEKLANLGLHL